MRITNILKVSVVTVSMMLLVSCGAMIKGTQQKLPINTDPPGAIATIGGASCKTPCALNVSRKAEKVEITKNGFSKEFSLERQVRTSSFVLDLFAVWFISLPVDYVTGGIYDLLPVNMLLPSSIISEPVVASPAVNSPSIQIRSDVDALPSVKKPKNNNAIGIVIGIEQYRQKLPPANFATQDAQLVTEYLTKVLGYPEENVVTLTNDHAGLGDFVKYFEKWLPNNVETGSSVFVYYSGHGAPNPKTGDAYLVPYDGDPTFIEETGYSLKRMYAALGKLPAKQVIVALDSCFSGAGGRSVLAKGARPIVLTAENPVLANKNIIVLSASAGDQISSTYDEKGHGLFTYFMLKGIKNEDVVKKDGSIDIESWFDYIKPQVSSIARKKYNNEQTPQLIGAKKK